MPRWNGPMLPVLGHRGPEISGVSYGSAGSPKVTPTTVLAQSNSYLFYRPTDSWSGAIGYADNHADFETSLAPANITYTTVSGSTHRDVLFYDEPDDPSGANACLGIFTTAGDEKKDWTAIWD